MTICYSYASRSRPERFFEGVENILAMSAQQDHFIIAKLDTDDVLMSNEAIRARLASYPSLIVRWGQSRSKIHAINRDLDNLPHWDIMICMSDDMRFTTKGYDDLVRKHMPADLDGYIHLMDDYAKDRVATVDIKGRAYYERDNYIYNEAYYSMWCDDENTAIAKARGKYILIPGIHVEHLHYTNKAKARKDNLYWRNDTYNKDKQIFEQRKAINFGL
jgi:adenine deaminase